MTYATVVNDRVFRYPTAELLKRIHGANAGYQSFSDNEMPEVSKRMKGAKLYAHKGKAVLADTDGHTAVANALGQIDGCMAGLAAIDGKYGQRATRSLALKAAREAGIGETDADLLRLGEAEERADALRRRMAALKESLGI